MNQQELENVIFEFLMNQVAIYFKVLGPLIKDGISLLQKIHFISGTKEILPRLHKRGNKGRHENLSFYPRFLINRGDS